jgi:hypothetical protein
MAEPFSIKVKSTYLKPLTPPRFGDLNPTTALRTLRTEMLRRIKAKLTQTTFSARAKRALAKALTIEVKESSVVITAHHPAWKPLIEGQKAGQMTWLTKARRPIPIVDESGEVVFRSATPKSMADGKWRHPGRAPTDFVEKARQEARKFVRDKLYREMMNQTRKALRSKR